MFRPFSEIFSYEKTISYYDFLMDVDYRKVEFSEEIIHLLDAYVQNKWPLLLWQSHARSEARNAIVTDFDIPTKSISVTLNTQGMKLNLSQPIYCRGDEKKMVFKSMNLTGQGNTLKISLPEDIRLYEGRSNQRYPMFANKKAFITVAVSSHYESKESSFVFKLNEISQAGCSVVMSSGNLVHFQVGSSLKLLQVGSDFVHGLVSAKVKYLQPMASKGQTEIQLYKVGIRFDKKISFANYYLTKNLEW